MTKLQSRVLVTLHVVLAVFFFIFITDWFEVNHNNIDKLMTFFICEIFLLFISLLTVNFCTCDMCPDGYTVLCNLFVLIVYLVLRVPTCIDLY